MVCVCSLAGWRAAVSSCWEACLLAGGWLRTSENLLQPPSAHTLQGRVASSALLSSSASSLRKNTHKRRFVQLQTARDHLFGYLYSRLLFCLKACGQLAGNTKTPVLTVTLSEKDNVYMIKIWHYSTLTCLWVPAQEHMEAGRNTVHKINCGSNNTH